MVKNDGKGEIMKFSEVEETTWDELSPYFDTCLIPYTGLTGNETPIQATKALERLRDFMDLVEIPFKGRVITYPAFQYGLGEDYSLLNEVCHHVKTTGFRYVIIMTADANVDGEKLNNCNLLLSLQSMKEEGQAISAAVIKEKNTEFME